MTTTGNLMDRVTAAVLAGGLGTRLQAALTGRPKALAEIHGRPFLDFLLDRIAEAGIRQAVLCTGHLAAMIRERYGDTYGPIRLEHSAEDRPLGTGGALRLAARRIQTPLAMVFNGDSVVDVDLTAFTQWFETTGAPAAILAVTVPDTSRYGSLRLSPDGMVEAFLEKHASTGPGIINAGIYLFRRDILDSMTQVEPLSLETQVFPALVGRGLAAYPVQGGFLDIGTPESYRAAEAFFVQP